MWLVRAALTVSATWPKIQQTSALDDGLVRDWPAPDLGIHKHYGYAFQWFALAATLLVFYLVTHVRKRLRQPQ